MYSKPKFTYLNNKKNKQKEIQKAMAQMLYRPTNFKHIQDFQYKIISCVSFVVFVLFVEVGINHQKFEKLAFIIWNIISN